MNKYTLIALSIIALTIGTMIPITLNLFIYNSTKYPTPLPVVIDVKLPSKYLVELKDVKTFRDYSELKNFLIEVSRLREGLNELLYRISDPYYYESPVLDLAERGTPTPASGTPKSDSGESTSYSKTNIQVEGVDELDIVKTNGRIIAISTGNKIYIVDPRNRRVLSTIRIIDVIQVEYSVFAGLYLVNDTLITVATSRSSPVHTSWRSPSMGFTGDQLSTFINIFNISNPETPALILNMTVTGELLSSRLASRYMYTVIQQTAKAESIPMVNNEPIEPGNIVLVDPTPDTYTTMLILDIEELKYSAVSFLTDRSSWMYMSHNRLYVASTIRADIYEAYIITLELLANYLPSEQRKGALEALSERNIVEAYDIINKYLKQLDENELENIRLEVKNNLNNILGGKEYHEVTRFYVFDFNGIDIFYKGFFDVHGNLLYQCSMEEMNDYFLVATTSLKITYDVVLSKYKYREPFGFITIYECTGIKCKYIYIPVGGREVESNIFINVFIETSEMTGNNLYIIRLTDLSIASNITGLAPGERIYAARLVKNIFFLVTFRQVDPLFAIDVGNPENPIVLGYLKMPGFSEYLHPIDVDRLLGIGLEEQSVLKITLFNVTDPTKMNIISEVKVENTWSPVLYDHHAFQLDEYYNRIYIPIHAHYQYTGGVIALKYNNNEIRFEKILFHDNAIRTIYMDGEVYTISMNLVKIYDRESLDQVSEIVLP